MGTEATAMRTLLILMAALSAAYGDQDAKETIRQTLPAAARLEVDQLLKLDIGQFAAGGAEEGWSTDDLDRESEARENMD